MREQNTYAVKEREIDVKKMLLYALRYWRLILLAGILGAAFMGVKQYKKDVAAANANIQTQIAAANAPEITVEYLESLLTMEQVQTVKSAVAYHEAAEKRQNYLDESIYMNINPYDENVTSIKFCVENQSVNHVANSFLPYIESEEFSKAIAQEIESEIESKYLAELFSIKETDAASYFVIKVIADTEEECKILADAAEKVLAVYTKELKKQDMLLSVSILNRASDVIIDTSLVATKSTYATEIYTNTGYVNSITANFFGTQLQLYNMLLQEGNSQVSVLKNDEVQASDEGTENTDVGIDTTINVKPNVKMMTVGFFVAIIIAYIIFTLKYTISKNIHGEDETVSLFGVRDFGMVNVVGVTGKSVLKRLDRSIIQLALPKRNRLTYVDEVELLVSNIELYCKNNSIQNVYFVGSDMKRVPLMVQEELIKKLSEAELHVEFGKSIVYDSDSMRKLVETGTCVFVELSEKSSCEEIAKELNKCKVYNINVLGMVMVQI